MFNPNKISNDTLKMRLVRNLSHGLRQLEIAGSEKKKTSAGTEFYLIKGTGEIISFREWYQKGKPNYEVCGSKEGCEGHKKRMNSVT